MKKYNVAVIGATGVVGRELIKTLAEREFPINNIHAIASAKSLGKKVSFGENDTLEIKALDGFDFKNIDIVFGAAGSSVSEKFSHRVKDAGAVLIDKTSFFRMRDDVPLIVPEVNEREIIGFKESRIIANPNCVAIPLALVLKPLDNASSIKRVVISTYQSVSGAGIEAMDELHDQTKAKYSCQSFESRVFERPISFNVIPKIGDFDDEGYTGEETKIMQELCKILKKNISITVTSVRVPVFIGHSISVNVECNNSIDANEAYEILAESDGVVVTSSDSSQKYVTPIDAAGEDAVFVSRIRNDASAKNAINMWITSDNLRKGAALNSVQIAESLLKYL